jgi:hypothetical protein
LIIGDHREIVCVALGIAWLWSESEKEKKRRRVFAIANKRVILDRCTEEQAAEYVRNGWTEYR